MTSFINLLANDIWSDADITNRTEGMVRAEFSATDETVINRKVSGATLGAYSLSDDDKADIGRFAAVTQSAFQAGVAARADMALLSKALAFEGAERRLAQPEITEPATVQVPGDAMGDKPVTVPNPAIAADQAERAAAHALIDTAGEDVHMLVELRRPPEQEPLIEAPHPGVEQ